MNMSCSPEIETIGLLRLSTLGFIMRLVARHPGAEVVVFIVSTEDSPIPIELG